MPESTTVRVARATRDHLNRLSAERGETVVSTIEQGLQLLEWEGLRKQTELDARRLGADAADRAEVAAALRDLTGVTLPLDA